MASKCHLERLGTKWSFKLRKQLIRGEVKREYFGSAVHNRNYKSNTPLFLRKQLQVTCVVLPMCEFPYLDPTAKLHFKWLMP